MLIPELTLRDPVAGARMLRDVLGFAGADGDLSFGDQRLILLEGEPDGRRGVVDHLALAVPDVDAALAGCLARGARLAANTPDGASDIPEFWEAGVRYAFLDGPEGARIELIAPRPPAAPRLAGHDHVGLACADVAPVRAFLLGLGFEERLAVTLERPGGPVPVSFLAWGGSVVEAYALPGTAPADGAGPWRLRARGLPHARGPEGLEIVPL